MRNMLRLCITCDSHVPHAMVRCVSHMRQPNFNVLSQDATQPATRRFNMRLACSVAYGPIRFFFFFCKNQKLRLSISDFFFCFCFCWTTNTFSQLYLTTFGSNGPLESLLLHEDLKVFKNTRTIQNSTTLKSTPNWLKFRI